MSHIFLSDVHLGAFSDEQNQHLENKLIRLVDYCEINDIQIHILGDFFDFWMEYPNYIPDIGQAVLERFEAYHKSTGNRSTYITGNHDFWTVSHFEECGFNVEHEYIHLQLDETDFFLCHGDGLKEEKFQLSRPILHKFIRDPRFITFYKTMLSAQTGVHIMKSFSSLTKDEKIETERLSSWAKFMAENFSYDVIISGHDHLPRTETFPGGTYINTGAFYNYSTVLMYNNRGFNLVIWSGEDQEFLPFQNQQN